MCGVNAKVFAKWHLSLPSLTQFPSCTILPEQAWCPEQVRTQFSCCAQAYWKFPEQACSPLHVTSQVPSQFIVASLQACGPLQVTLPPERIWSSDVSHAWSPWQENTRSVRTSPLHACVPTQSHHIRKIFQLVFFKKNQLLTVNMHNKNWNETPGCWT